MRCCTLIDPGWTQFKNFFILKQFQTYREVARVRRIPTHLFNLFFFLGAVPQSLIFFTQTFLKSTGQLFFRVSSNLGFLLFLQHQIQLLHHWQEFQRIPVICSFQYMIQEAHNVNLCLYQWSVFKLGPMSSIQPCIIKAVKAHLSPNSQFHKEI